MGSEVVKQALNARIAAEGRVTFAEFMDIALYHPTDGYYNRSEMTIGEGGDFYTSPMVHPIFGACIARQVFQMWQALGRPATFYILEMGAGAGALAADFLNEAKKREDYYTTIHYQIVEQSPSLQEKQRARLTEDGHIDKITWYNTLDEVTAATGTQVGVIVTNELFDALPVHRLKKTADGFHEYYVERSDEGYHEVEGPLSDPALLNLLNEETLNALALGDRLEVCPAAAEVIKKMGLLLDKGFVLTIDYGDKAPDVHKHWVGRMNEGVRAYYKQAPSRPYVRIGEQDLTADVDFSLLVDRGQEVGLMEVGFTNQLHLLGGNGFLNKCAELETRVRNHDLNADFELARMVELFLPHKLGKVFKVLIQVKGLDVEPLRNSLSLFRFSVDDLV